MAHDKLAVLIDADNTRLAIVEGLSTRRFTSTGM
jgi:hypothetical protein